MPSTLQLWRSVAGGNLLGDPAVKRAVVSAPLPVMVQDLFSPPVMLVLCVSYALHVRLVFLRSVRLGLGRAIMVWGLAFHPFLIEGFQPRYLSVICKDRKNEAVSI